MKLKKIDSFHKQFTDLLHQYRTLDSRKKAKKLLKHLEKFFEDWCDGCVYGEVKKKFNYLFEEHLLLTWKDTPSQFSKDLRQLLEEQASSSITELMSEWRMEELDHTIHECFTDALLCKLMKAFQREELHPVLFEQLLEIILKDTLNTWKESEEITTQTGWLDLKNQFVDVLKMSAMQEELPEFISSRLPRHDTTMDELSLPDVHFEALLESWRKGLVSEAASDWLQIKFKPVLLNYIQDDSNFYFWKDKIENGFQSLIKDMYTFGSDSQLYEEFVLSLLKDCINEEDIHLVRQYAVKAIRKEWQGYPSRERVTDLISDYIAHHTIIPVQEWVESLHHYLRPTLKELIYKKMKVFCMKDTDSQVLYKHLKAGENDESTDSIILHLLNEMSEKLRKIIESRSPKLYQYMLQREKIYFLLRTIREAYSNNTHAHLIFDKLYFSLLSDEIITYLIERTASMLNSLVIKNDKALKVLEEKEIFTQLSELTVGFYTALHSISLVAPKLEKLSLFECPQLRTIRIDSRFLKSIDIENCSQIMLDRMIDRFFPALTNLRLAYFHNMPRLLINAPSLEQLVLIHSSQLEYIQTGSKQLKKVILSFCDALILSELSSIAEQTYSLKTFQIDATCYTLPVFVLLITRYPTLLQYSHHLSKLTSDELAVFEEYYVLMKDKDDWLEHMKVHMQTHSEKLSSSMFFDDSITYWRSILSEEQQDLTSQCIAASNLGYCQPIDEQMVSVWEKSLSSTLKDQVKAVQSLSNARRYNVSHIEILIAMMSKEKYQLKAISLFYEYCRHGFSKEIVKSICEEMETCSNYTILPLLEFVISLYDLEQLIAADRKKLIETLLIVVSNTSLKNRSLYYYESRSNLIAIRALFRWGHASTDLISDLCAEISPSVTKKYYHTRILSNSDNLVLLQDIFKILSFLNAKLHKYATESSLKLLNDLFISKAKEDTYTKTSERTESSKVIIGLLVTMNVMNDSNIVKNIISTFLDPHKTKRMYERDSLFDTFISALTASRVFFTTFLNCLLYEPNSFNDASALVYQLDKHNLKCFSEKLSGRLPITFQEDIFGILQNSKDEEITSLLLGFLSHASKIDSKFEPILCSVFSDNKNTRKIRTSVLYLLSRVVPLSSVTLEMIVSLASGVETASADYLSRQDEEWLEEWFEENKESIKRQSSAVKTLGKLNLENFSVPDRNKVLICLHNLEKNPFFVIKTLHSLISLGEGDKTNAMYALKLGNELANFKSCGWGGFGAHLELIWKTIVAVYGLNREGMLTVINALEKNDMGAVKLLEIFTGMICRTMDFLDRHKLVYNDKDIGSLSKFGYSVLEEYLFERLKQKEFPIAFYIIEYFGRSLKGLCQQDEYLSVLLNVLTEDWKSYRICKLVNHKYVSKDSDFDMVLSESDEDDSEVDENDIKKVIKERHLELRKVILKYIRKYANCNQSVIETLIHLLDTDNALQEDILDTLEKLNYSKAGEATSLVIHYFLPFIFDSSSDEDSDDERIKIDSVTAYRILKKLHVSQLTDHDFDFFMKALFDKANPDSDLCTSERAAYKLIKHFAKQLEGRGIQFVNVFLDVYSPHEARFQKLAESLFSKFFIDTTKLQITRDLLIRLNMHSDPAIRKFSAELTYAAGMRTHLLQNILGKWSSTDITDREKVHHLHHHRFFKDQNSVSDIFPENTSEPTTLNPRRF